MKTLTSAFLFLCVGGVACIGNVPLTQESSDEIFEKGIDKLVARVLKAGPSDRADLEGTTLEKLSKEKLPLDAARMKHAKERGLFNWFKNAKAHTSSFMPGTGLFFDLDDCLFPFVGTGIDKYEINIASQFLILHMHFTEDQVKAFRRMFREKGLTIWSALLQVEVSPSLIETFKKMLMDGIPYETLIKPDKQLRADLMGLPQAPKYILTNNFRCHAERVIKCLGIDDLFETVIGIDDLNAPKQDKLIHKPSYEFYKIAMLSVGAKYGLMVDDRNKNCVGAVNAGMFAVQMTKYLEKSPKPMSRAESMEHIIDPHSTIPIVQNVKDLGDFAYTLGKVYGGKAQMPFGDNPPLMKAPAL